MTFHDSMTLNQFPWLFHDFQTGGNPAFNKRYERMAEPSGIELHFESGRMIDWIGLGVRVSPNSMELDIKSHWSLNATQHKDVSY